MVSLIENVIRSVLAAAVGARLLTIRVKFVPCHQNDQIRQHTNSNFFLYQYQHHVQEILPFNTAAPEGRLVRLLPHVAPNVAPDSGRTAKAFPEPPTSVAAILAFDSF